MVGHGQPRAFKISQTAIYLEIKTSITFGRTRWSLYHRLAARMPSPRFVELGKSAAMSFFVKFLKQIISVVEKL